MHARVLIVARDGDVVQDVHERHELEAIGEAVLDVFDLLVLLLEVGVDPARERLLLREHPLGRLDVLAQILASALARPPHPHPVHAVSRSGRCLASHARQQPNKAAEKQDEEEKEAEKEGRGRTSLLSAAAWGKFACVGVVAIVVAAAVASSRDVSRKKEKQWGAPR